MLRRIFLLAIIISSFFVSMPVLAQSANGTSNIPELNPFCWKKKDCMDMREKYEVGSPSESELAEGFITGSTAAPCNGGVGLEEWGRCLPAGITRTEISFGGQTRFANIGEFILLMYKYLVSTASIVAAVMIVIAGLQWVTSGGNSETISSAKHRIGGALIGLLIAFLSYFILNTVNPALVNFRLPQVWLIRSQQLIPKFCNQIQGADEGKLKFRFYATEADQTSAVDITKAGTEEMPYGQKDANGLDIFYCGRRFLAKDGGTQACFGSMCPWKPGDRQICAQEGENQNMSCKQGELVTHLRINVDTFDLEEQVSQSLDKVNLGIFITKAMETNWIIKEKFFRGVCRDGKMLYLANGGAEKSWPVADGGIPKTPYWEYQHYYNGLVDFQDKGWTCGRGGQLVGYFLRMETAAKQSVWADFKDSLSPVSAFFPVYGAVKFASNLFGNASLPNLNIGYDRATGKAVFGTFVDDIKSLNNYIPIEELEKGGLSLNVDLTIGSLVRMKGKSGDSPGSYLINIVPGVPVE